MEVRLAGRSVSQSVTHSNNSAGAVHQLWWCRQVAMGGVEKGRKLPSPRPNSLKHRRNHRSTDRLIIDRPANRPQTHPIQDAPLHRPPAQEAPAHLPVWGHHPPAGAPTDSSLSCPRHCPPTEVQNPPSPSRRFRPPTEVPAHSSLPLRRCLANPSVSRSTGRSLSQYGQTSVHLSSSPIGQLASQQALPSKRLHPIALSKSPPRQEASPSMVVLQPKRSRQSFGRSVGWSVAQSAR